MAFLDTMRPSTCTSEMRRRDGEPSLSSTSSTSVQMHHPPTFTTAGFCQPSKKSNAVPLNEFNMPEPKQMVQWAHEPKIKTREELREYRKQETLHGIIAANSNAASTPSLRGSQQTREILSGQFYNVEDAAHKQTRSKLIYSRKNANLDELRAQYETVPDAYRTMNQSIHDQEPNSPVAPYSPIKRRPHTVAASRVSPTNTEASRAPSLVYIEEPRTRTEMLEERKKIASYAAQTPPETTKRCGTTPANASRNRERDPGPLCHQETEDHGFARRQEDIRGLASTREELLARRKDSTKTSNGNMFDARQQQAKEALLALTSDLSNDNKRWFESQGANSSTSSNNSRVLAQREKAKQVSVHPANSREFIADYLKSKQNHFNEVATKVNRHKIETRNYPVKRHVMKNRFTDVVLEFKSLTAEKPIDESEYTRKAATAPLYSCFAKDRIYRGPFPPMPDQPNTFVAPEAEKRATTPSLQLYPLASRKGRTRGDQNGDLTAIGDNGDEMDRKLLMHHGAQIRTGGFQIVE